MAGDDRYDISALPEAQFESGSDRQVLKNRLGITSQQEMDDGVLQRCTPCISASRNGTIGVLAEVHVELVLIHPFRDGNGRLARILSTLMALQAGLPLLDFSVIAGEKKNDYFSAVQAGLDRNYSPIEGVFAEVIEETLRGS